MDSTTPQITAAGSAVKAASTYPTITTVNQSSAPPVSANAADQAAHHKPSKR